MSERLRELARIHGIASEYHDIWGTLHRVGDATLRALLSAMGVDTSSEDAVEHSLNAATRLRWERIVDAATVAREGTDPLALSLRLPQRFDQMTLRWRVAAEDGREWSATFTPATLPRSDVAVVDGTGAGDAFAAGLIYGKLAGWPFERRLQLANAVGALATTAVGASEGVRGLDETLALAGFA